MVLVNAASHVYEYAELAVADVGRGLLFEIITTHCVSIGEYAVQMFFRMAQPPFFKGSIIICSVWVLVHKSIERTLFQGLYNLEYRLEIDVPLYIIS